MENITVGQVFLLLLGAAGFWTFLGKLFDAWLDKRKRKREKGDKDVDQTAAIAKLNVTAEEHTAQLLALQEGQSFLLFDKVEYFVLKRVEENSISLKQLKYLDTIYKVYKKLGGDGLCDEYMEIARNLPIKQ